MLYPLPAILVSCGSEAGEYNVFTASWVGTLCSNPPMCYVSIRPERHSHGIISRRGEFVLNLTTVSLAYATDWCGVKSGREHNKFEAMGLSVGKSSVVSAPTVGESPLSIECRVSRIVPLGSHDMFMAEVVNVQAEDKYLDAESGAFNMEAAGLLAYSHGKYFGLGEMIGRFGWTVKKGG